jgi:hypothetical protein
MQYDFDSFNRSIAPGVVWLVLYLRAINLGKHSVVSLHRLELHLASRYVVDMQRLGGKYNHAQAQAQADQKRILHYASV